MSRTSHIICAKLTCFLFFTGAWSKTVQVREADSPGVIHFHVYILKYGGELIFFFWQARKARRRNIVRQIRNWRRLKLCLSHSLKWREACFNGLKLGCSRRVMWTASTACEVTEKLVTFIVYSEFVTKLEYARRVLWAIRTTSTVGHMYRVQSH